MKKGKKDEEVAESGLKEADPIEKAEKDFFKIVEEEKARRKKKMDTGAAKEEHKE